MLIINVELKIMNSVVLDHVTDDFPFLQTVIIINKTNTKKK